MADEPANRDWMVADFPVEKRKKFVGYCGNRKEKVALWVERACEQLMQLEAGENVFPPDKPLNEPVNPGTSLTVYQPPRLTVDFAGLAAGITTMAASYAALGQPMPVGLVQDAGATMKAMMREARGLPPIAYKPRPALTKSVDGELSQNSVVLRNR